MGVFLNIDYSLPLVNPVLKFLIILLIILIIPVIFNRLRIPSILGLILAGAIIGPTAFNVMERDSGIILSGTAGLLYIMFLAGLEVDMGDFKKHRFKSIVFGLYTFCIPMLLGIFGGLYLLDFSLMTSVLLASMFASHTLIAYPIIRKLGITRNIAVNITVGGTIITDTLALLVLAVIVGMSRGEVNTLFWLIMALKVLIFGIIVIFLFPILGNWFFRNIDDSVAQYIFILTMVFFAAFLAEVAGVEGIIGAFLAGLSLNRLIPKNSSLMNRVEFVGNAIFIPFFLISIGMLIDYKLFFEDFDTLKVGGIMIFIATISKYLAAIATRKTFSFTKAEGEVIFGLSNAQAAATLAAVLIGYNIVLGETPAGEPIRLLNENVLNGTILMILFTCTLATFSAAKGGKGVAVAKVGKDLGEEPELKERILISLKNIHNVEDLVNLALLFKAYRTKELFALNILDSANSSEEAEKYSESLVNRAGEIAVSGGNKMHRLLRYDSSFTNGILGTIKENQITDVILGLHVKKELSDSFLGELTEGVLSKARCNIFIYKSIQPIISIKRFMVYLPFLVEEETGFPALINKLWQLSRNSGKRLFIYASVKTMVILKRIQQEFPIEVDFISLSQSNYIHSIDTLMAGVKPNDNIILVQKRAGVQVVLEKSEKLSAVINSRLLQNSFILVYLYNDVLKYDSSNLMNASVIEPVQKLDEVFRQIIQNFKSSGN